MITQPIEKWPIRLEKRVSAWGGCADRWQAMFWSRYALAVLLGRVGELSS